MSSRVRRHMTSSLLCALCVSVASFSVWAEDAPKVAGTDVPPPKRTRTVLPEYPAEAQAKGIHGIVILELTIDAQGKVASVRVVRSVPPFDEPAMAAVKKWEYEITESEGKPVSVLLTVPITFALKVPEVSRQEGIPELRQGTSPVYPKGGKGGGKVTVEVTLDDSGRISDMEATSGDAPWLEALLQALRTWRFAPPDQGAQMSFRVEGDFQAARAGSPDRVSVRLSGLRVEGPAAPSAQPAPAAAQSPEPAPPASAAAPPATATPPAPPLAPPSMPPAPAPTVRPKATGTPAPVTEVLTVPPRAAPAIPAPGTSAVEGVTLSLGVPDLTKGRRPVAPPFARMAGVSGTVEVRFAVSAAGLTSLLSVEGPDLLKAAAQDAVASWAFRRTTADRLFLTAVFSYEGDKATASVAPTPEAVIPTAPPAATPSPAPPPSQP